ncbi:MAG: peptidylprolyl isomerase [Sulfurovum sp.]|nr:peptidylprolyl isomerase [Sulfurovum sp.]
MKKFVLFILIAFLSLAEARVIDGIALIVEGEPITTAEIRAIQTQMRVSKSKATSLLIQDRLQKSAMNDIQIDEKVIDAKVADIASQNNITVSKMQKVLKKQGTSWNKYRSNIRDALKKKKFFQTNIRQSIPEPTQDELKIYYRNHKKEFVLPKSISLIEYSTPTMKAMKAFLQTKNKKGVKHQRMKKNTKDLDATLLQSMLQTQNNSFTQPLNAGDRFISYKVLSKNGKTTMPFDTAQSAVTNKWKQQQQSKALKDYFEKLKTNADIEYIRR